MIKNIEIKNFKCFGEAGVALELAPLTIFVGPNGSGKSSALDAIGLLSQTAESPGGIRWEGPWVELGVDGKFAFHQTDPGAFLSVLVTLTNGNSIDKWVRERGLTDELTQHPTSFGYLLKHSGEKEYWLHEIYVDGKVSASHETVLQEKTLHGSSHQARLRYKDIGRDGGEIEMLATQMGSQILDTNLFTGQVEQLQVDAPLRSKINVKAKFLVLLTSYLRDFLKDKVFLVGADRKPERISAKTEHKGLRVGRHGGHTLAVLSPILSSAEFSAQSEKIRRWAEIFGLPELKSGWVGEPMIQADFRDPSAKISLDLASAGYGSRQILPVITQIFAAPAGSVVMIEEPEISLHPEAQVQLISMFADAIESGRQIITTTHSQTVLLSLAEAAKSHSLSPRDVAVYHFSCETDGHKAIRLELEDDWYIKGWVPSFSEVESRLLKEWSQRVSEKIKNE